MVEGGQGTSSIFENRKHMLIWLFLGLGMLGLATGWLIGGSATPIAGAALPILLGLGVTASQLVSERRRDKLLTALSSAGSSGAVEQIMAELKAEREQLSANVGRLGGAIFAFSLPLVVGIILGGLARVQHWYVERPRVPWDEKDPPDDIEEIVGLLSIRSRLAAQEFSQDDVAIIVRRLHAIDQKADEARSASPPEWPGVPFAQPEMPDVSPLDKKNPFEFDIGPGASGGNPIANVHDGVDTKAVQEMRSQI